MAAVSAAVWFDFFFTLPYYRFTIRSSADVTTAVLLLLTGLAVSQLAVRARRLKVIAITDAGYLVQIHETTVLAQSARPGRRSSRITSKTSSPACWGWKNRVSSSGRCSAIRRAWRQTAP